MLKSQRKIRPGVTEHRAAGILTILVLTCLALAPGPGLAIEVASLYTAQVTLDPNRADPRSSAYTAALAQVLLRVSGSELTNDRETVDLLFPDPAAYVMQFRPGDEDTLWVTFDGQAIEQTLRQAGQTVWGKERPLTLIWLAVDWGRGQREIIAADDPERRRDAARSIDRNRLLRQRVLNVAERRGLPIVFPLLDSADLRNISFSDIWGGFDESVLEASRRYDAASILVGRVRATSSQRNRWSYHFAGDERTWSGEPELVIGLVADLLADEFAISGSAPPEWIDLSIGGIDSVHDYGAVQRLLAGVTVIEKYTIAEVDGDLIRYRVEVHGDRERLRRALRLSGLIEQNDFDGDTFPPDTVNTSLNFFYSP